MNSEQLREGISSRLDLLVLNLHFVSLLTNAGCPDDRVEPQNAISYHQI